VADKRRVKKTIKNIQRVKTWQLVVLLLLAGLMAATFLRLNNVGMVERRTAVLHADEAGDKIALFNNLYALQRYVSEHMNTDPGRIALQHQYERDAEAARDKAERTASDKGDNAYQKASKICDPQAIAQGWHWPDPRYLGCINKELKKFPDSQVAAIELPNVNLYYHSFYSPAWSPDFAGWSLVVCAVILLVIIARLASLAFLKALLRKHYSSI
jgi:hypothetical protein